MNLASGGIVSLQDGTVNTLTSGGDVTLNSAALSFDLGSLEAARRFLNQVKICALAESLGGVESLISLPAIMTHASMPKEVQQRIGITEGLVRLSVGIEDLEDILDDLDQALLHV